MAGFGIAGIVASGSALAILGFAPMFLDRVFMRRAEMIRAQRVIAKLSPATFAQRLQGHKSVGIRMIPSDQPQGWGLRLVRDTKFQDFHGAEAIHIAHLVAPLVNVEGGNKEVIRKAVEEIERAGSAENYFRRVLDYGKGRNWKITTLAEYPGEIALAFEMAAHESTEKVALAGELAQLEQDWREAEEIASIADNLFLPQSVTDFIARHRREKTISAPE